MKKLMFILVLSHLAHGAVRMTGGLADKLVVAWNKNIGPYDAGGVYVYQGVLRNSLVYGNYTPRYGGGVRYDYGIIENCTIVGNQAGVEMGGIFGYLYGIARNCIIVSNTALKRMENDIKEIKNDIKDTNTNVSAD